MKDKCSATRLPNGMYYTTDEITAMYRDAKDKREQIKILAQLNACTQEQIINFLIDAGVSKKSLPRANKAEKAAGEKKSYHTITDKRPRRTRSPKKKDEYIQEAVVETCSESSTESEWPEDSTGYKNATLVGCILQSQAEAEERYNVNLAATDHTIATNETIEVNQNTEVHASNSSLDMLNSILERMKHEKSSILIEWNELKLKLEKVNSDIERLDMNIEAVERTITVVANMTKN